MKAKRLTFENLETRELFAGMAEIVGPVQVPRPAEHSPHEDRQTDVDNQVGSAFGFDIDVEEREDSACDAGISGSSVTYNATTQILEIDGTDFRDIVNIYRLVAVEGEPVSTAAEALGMSVGAISIAKSRVTARLRELLENEDS